MSTPKLKRLPRPFRAVELPGGGTVHVRDLSLAELRAIDQRAEEEADGEAARNVRRVELLCAYALAGEDGVPLFPAPTAADLAEVAGLTVGQMEAIASAAVPTKADAKN